MNQYEIEIKSLLGNKENADELIGKMKQVDTALETLGSHKQLNHYFIPTAEGSLETLFNNVKDFIDTGKSDKLKELANKAKDFSVRTRWADGKVILVVKASVDDTTSSNGTARLEWESPVSIPNLTKEKSSKAETEEKNIDIFNSLDKLVLQSGFQYQAKWSRERQEFIFHPNGRGRSISVSIDKNAGYGYLSEFEIVSNDPNKADEIKAFIRETMESLGITELPQDRLARMFDHYNNNWSKYYGTDNIFTIE